MRRCEIQCVDVKPGLTNAEDQRLSLWCGFSAYQFAWLKAKGLNHRLSHQYNEGNKYFLLAAWKPVNAIDDCVEMGQWTILGTTVQKDKRHLNKVFVIHAAAIKEVPNKLSVSMEKNVYSLYKAIS